MHVTLMQIYYISVDIYLVGYLHQVEPHPTKKLDGMDQLTDLPKMMKLKSFVSLMKLTRR